MTGEWSSELGTGGTFELFPHVGARVESVTPRPEQLYTTNKDIGALRLYKSDITELIANVQKKFPGSKVVVTHLERGAELARFSDDFYREIHKIVELRWIKINAQETVSLGLQRVLTIDLGPNFNRITTQGPDESWVLGEAEATASFLRSKEKKLSTAIGKYRVNFNQIIALCALSAMPELEFWSRFYFVFLVSALIISATKAQTALIPNLIVSLSESEPNWLRQSWPSLVSWMVSMTAAVAASILYGFLVGVGTSH